MIKLGLTGNIGSGKTTVSRIFESIGIPIFYADLEAKKLYGLDSIKNKILSIFGNSVFNDNKEVDFKSLANIVFNDKGKLKELTNILHPMVFEVYSQWLETNSNEDYTIHESAIIFEYSQQHFFDKIVCVVSPTKLRIERVIKRDQISNDSVKERIDNQMLQSEKESLSDFIISNDKNHMLIPQVLKLHNLLTGQKK